MDNAIHQVLQLNKKSTRKYPAYLKYAVVFFLIAAISTFWLWPGKNGNTFQYQTTEAQLGDLTVTVIATGVLQPLNQVDVGTETSGTVQTVLVDFNDRVSLGQVLARLNTEQLSAKLRQSKAALALAKASLKESEATVQETRVKLRRAQDLEKKQMGSQDTVDTAQAAYTRAVASLERAKAQITQAEAQLDLDKTALSKAEIRSPINGIVLTRQIEPGQTVAASLQTPILFTLAENLTQMELHVSVDEADVGMVSEGQGAVFKVDAFERRSFPAKISQVRFAPQTVEGVVTYETVLSVNNEDLALRPGMTATAEIVVQRLQHVLLVPNAALRFKPPKIKTKEKTGLLSQLFSRRRHNSDKEAGQENGQNKQTNVWVLQDGEPVKVTVKTGATDGRLTQILEGPIKPGVTVITDSISSEK